MESTQRPVVPEATPLSRRCPNRVPHLHPGEPRKSSSTRLKINGRLTQGQLRNTLGFIKAELLHQGVVPKSVHDTRHQR
jgi:hypothetical protein